MAISSLAPSSVLVAASVKLFPSMARKSGSTLTSWRTSVRSDAVRCLSSSCGSIGKPPLLQDKECSTEEVEPQEQLEGRRDGCQPYLKAKASWKAPLYKVKPYSCISRVSANWKHAPFSDARSIALFRESGRFYFKASACCFDC